MSTSHPDAPERSHPRALWRSRDEREAAKAEARAKTAQAELDEQRLRAQRDTEQIEADRERERLQREADAERQQDKPLKDDARGTDRLTFIAAGIATIVAGQGMWQFLDRIIGDVPWPLRALMFAFLEIAVVTSAKRARASMRKNLSAGIDGVAVWMFTAVSAVLAAMEARSLPEGVFRLAAPLVAAWLWERGMAIERHRIRGTSGINWRLTPERILVRLGIAEATDRTASEVDAHRRLKRVALAVKKLHQLRKANSSDRKIAAALTKRDRFLDQAVEHTDLARNPRTQEMLLDLVTALGGADSLSDLLDTAMAPWANLDHPAITGKRRLSEAARLAEETRRLSDAVLAQRDPEAAATIEMLASMVVGRRIPPPGTDTRDGVAPSVADLVAGRVSLRAVPLPPNDTTSATQSDTGTATGDQVAPEVADEVADLDAEEILWQLREEPDDDIDDTETATTSATDAMWRHWQQAVAKGELPTGADLAREGGCVESYGRRKRNEWLSQLDGRTRRRLLGATRRERTAS
ncbi:hypothetical protein [Nonomuraea zeae]|uniref:DUF2637 domain-containing protein n=1 Tax=Nonomuraea zeae TaxID=1642303 RepID=A0A5S4H2V3_9ACTN|nr:hypothetical protein [Nonomuraea zeae]TMR39585.1 hypothetical protein ETD85_00805 [Nonomuraea zeae]